MEKTKEFAKQWIEDDKPCCYRYGYAFKGAKAKPINKEKALELLPKYTFGMSSRSLNFIKFEGEDCLEFNELSANDMY